MNSVHKLLLCSVMILGVFVTVIAENRKTVQLQSEIGHSGQQTLTSQSANVKSDISSVTQFFVENRGQFNSSVQFQCTYKNSSVWFTKREVVHQLTHTDYTPSKDQGTFDRTSPLISHSDIVRFSFLNASESISISGKDSLRGRINYLLGNDKSRWVTNTPIYSQIMYHDVYDNISLQYYFKGNVLEYDFVVLPGGIPSDIRISVDGSKTISVDNSGSLLIELNGGNLVKETPLIYQQIEDRRIIIDGEFVVIDSTTIGFRILDRYDKSIALVIDPEIRYSSFLGGGGKDVPWSVDQDECGNIYVSGATHSTDFPEKANGSSFADSGNVDIFVSKFNTNFKGASSLVYSTYIGGGEADWGDGGMKVDESGRAIVNSYSASDEFPVTANAYQDTAGLGQTTVIFILNEDGDDLDYSTFLGTVLYSEQLDIDVNGNIYGAGWGYLGFSYLPPTLNSFDTLKNTYPREGFVYKLNPNQNPANQLEYSSWLGGHGITLDIATETEDICYVTGVLNDTPSTFPIKPNDAYQTTFNSSVDGFVIKFDMSKVLDTSITYSTLFGGAGNDSGLAITFDHSSQAIITGFTASSDLETSTNSYDDDYGGNGDAFVFVLSDDGRDLVYCTYLGGDAGATGEDIGLDLSVNQTGHIYVVGPTNSNDFETLNEVEGDGADDDFDVFVSILDPEGTGSGQLLFSTYIGGSSRDHGAHGISSRNDSVAYIVGPTNSTDFDYSSNAYDTTHNDSADAFVMVLQMIPPSTSAPFRVGDVNMDGYVNDSDAEILTKLVLNQLDPADYCPAAGDVNFNDSLSLLDVTELINYLEDCTSGEFADSVVESCAIE